MQPLHDVDWSAVAARVVVICVFLAGSFALASAAGGTVLDGRVDHAPVAPGASDLARDNCAAGPGFGGVPATGSSDTQSREQTDAIAASADASASPTGTVRGAERATVAEREVERFNVAERDAETVTVAEHEAQTVPLGGLAFVDLSVPAGSNSTVVVGAETDHSVELTVRDDGDGRATVRINTYVAANGTTVEPDAFAATGADTVRVRTTETDERMTTGTYPVTVRQNGSVVDEQSLSVTAPSFGNVTALRAPPQLSDAGRLAALETADEFGMLAGRDPGENVTRVRYGETLVFRIDSPTLLGVVAAQPGDTTTEKFNSTYGRHRGQAVDPAIEGPCFYLDFGASVEAGAARAISDYENGTVYLVLDTDDTEPRTVIGKFDLDVDAPNRLGDYSEYRRFEQSRFSDPKERPRVDRIGPYSYRKRVDAVVAWPNDSVVEITGETDRESLNVTVRSLVDPTYERRKTAQVSGETFSESVSLPEAVRPGLFRVSVGNASYTATVGDVPNATWDLAPPTGADRVSRIPIEQLKLEDGGFLVAYRSNANGSGFQRVGAASTRDVVLPIAPVNESQHLLVVAHRDGNGNGRYDGPETDPAYRVDGEAVREWVSVETAETDETLDPPVGTFGLDDIGEPHESAATPVATPLPTTAATTTSAEPTPVSTPTSVTEPTETNASPETPTSSEAETGDATPSPGSAMSGSSPGSQTETGTARMPDEETAAEAPGFGLTAVLLALGALSGVLARRRA